MFHPCPMCDIGRARYYVCPDCKKWLDRELGPDWMHTDWWKAIAKSAGRLALSEGRERALIVQLNENLSQTLEMLQPAKTVYERAVEAIREGVLDEGELLARLTAGKKRVDRHYYKKVIARALADLADELPRLRDVSTIELEYELELTEV